MRKIMEILLRITLQQENCLEEIMLHDRYFIFHNTNKHGTLCVPELPLSFLPS